MVQYKQTTWIDENIQSPADNNILNYPINKIKNI
jgi:hypothetical protein